MTGTNSGAGSSAEDSVIIVGSGPCGAMAARELVRRSVYVTLLESGAGAPRGGLVRIGGHPVFRYVDDGPLRWDSGFAATNDPTTAWYRTLAGGGLSNYWTGAVPRFSPADFGSPTADEAHRWPLGYDDLAVYYERAEDAISVTASAESVPNLPANTVSKRVDLDEQWQPIAESAATYGHDVVPMPLAKGSPHMAVGRGTEFNSWHNIVNGLSKSPYFTLITNAHVQRLNWDAPSGRVASASYVDHSTGVEHEIHGTAFVIAAGAINSTKLLLASRSSDFPDGLGNTHDVLGRYLHDHPKDWWPLESSTALPLPAHPIYMTRSVHEDEFAASWTVGLASSRDRPKTYVGRAGTRFGVQVFGTMEPTPEHRVSLRDGQTDENGDPVLNIHFGYDQSTIDDMLATRQRFIDVFATAGVSARVETTGVSLTPGESVHYGGSIRMHESPEFGMVDKDCRLHAVQNVQVVDTSVFTTGPEKNPTLTAMAIAARAMETLRRS